MKHSGSRFQYGLQKATFLVTLGLLFWAQFSAAYSSLEARPASPWSAQLNLTGSRGSDELDHYYFGASATLGYSHRPWHSVYASVGYNRPSANEVENPDRYGATDSTLGYSIRRLIHLQNGIEADGDFKITLPTSTISNRASLQALVGPALSVRYPLYKQKLYARTAHEAAYGFYRYETADEAGYRYNSPWMFTNGVGLGLRIYKTTTAVDYDFTHLIDYADTRINVQTLRVSLGVAVTGQASVAAYARWRDRVVTDNALFDTDTRVIGLSFRYFM